MITTQVFLRVELKSFPHFRVNKLRVFAEPACTLFCLTVYRHMDTCINECYSASLDLSAGNPREDFFFFFPHIYLLVAVKTKIPKISSPPLQAAFGRIGWKKQHDPIFFSFYKLLHLMKKSTMKTVQLRIKH